MVLGYGKTGVLMNWETGFGDFFVDEKAEYGLATSPLTQLNKIQILGSKSNCRPLVSDVMAAGFSGNYISPNFGLGDMAFLSQMTYPQNFSFVSLQLTATSAAFRSRVASLLDAYAYFEFEEGIEEDFTPQVSELIRINALETIQAIKDEILTDRFDPEYVWNILRHLGGINDPRSRSERLLLLQEFLTHSSRWIRDGAALGLILLGESAARVSLQRAIDRERLPDLKADLSKALSYLIAKLE